MSDAVGAASGGGDAGAAMPATAAVVIDVWSDYVCPFCYLELPVLDRVRETFGAEAVEVVWHAFELRPEPVPTLEPAGDYLVSVWSRSVYPMAAERGMVLKLPPVQPRSRKAFEATAFARDAGRGEAMLQALFTAFFEHGRDIGRIDELAAVGCEVGLDAEALRDALDRGVHAGSVLAEEAEAGRLGIRGVPLMVLRRRGEPLRAGRPLQGAQPYEAVAGVVAGLLAAPV